MSYKETNDNDTYNSLSERLNYLIESAGVKKKHLASKIGISPQALNHICKKGTSRSRHTEQIAKALNANPEWLASGSGSPFYNPTDQQAVSCTQINIYTLSKLNAVYYSAHALLQLPPDEKILLNIKESQLLLGFYMENELFKPRFEVNDIIIVDCSNQPKRGELGLIYSSVFKKYLVCYLYQDIQRQLTFGCIPGSEIGLFEIQDNDIVYGSYKLCLKTI